MEELRDLKQICSLAANRFNQYGGNDFILPQMFKEQVKEIYSSTITYNEYSAVIETKGTQNGVLNIFLPNQWFYIASYFTDFYNELQRYKKEALKVVSKERLKILNGSTLTTQEEIKLQRLPLNETSKSYLIKFITDYSWWNGGKTIDRGDFYVSPILNSAKLVNASQSYVAELCAFLSDKTELVKAIISGEEAASHAINNEKSVSSFQQIFYGAPGTGKSNTIKKETANAEKDGRVIRTTFHPDSDYSTFVGAYKPSMKPTDKIYSVGELAVKLKEIKNSGVTYPCHKFAAQYWRSLKDLTTEATKQILTACGFTESMAVEISKGVAIGQEYLNKDEDGKIIYTFCPQAFTNAYVKAWNTEKDVYLVIEEINRGNCAQIFGDLFQLLDRKNGVSEYPIEADTDLRNYLQKGLADTERKDIPENVKSGEKLMLPKNFYIWATMNTSDQSLFPIDSAFKRRWEWKYMKIKNHPEENYRIKIGEKEQDWWEFVKKINEIIASMTSSADKQLGYFFCCAKDGVIDEDTFVSKVIFYLWNDVFKDYGFEDASLFRYKDENGVEHDLTFPDFYDEDGEKVNTERLTDFVKKVMDWKKASEENA